MSGLLANKVALIAGNAAATGRMVAMAMAREGARLALADARLAVAEEAAAAVRAAGGDAIAIQADLASEAGAQKLVATAVDHYGQLDCAFNNANAYAAEVGAVGLAHQVSLAGFDAMMAGNVGAVFACLKYEIATMIRQGHGAIVNFATTAGLSGIGGSVAYTAAKHAVVGMTKAAALECAPLRIRVNTVCAGFVMTDRNRANDARNAQVQGFVPSGRLGDPDEVAQAIVWLCSDRASMVNGQALAVDDGFGAGISMKLYAGSLMKA